MPVFSIVKPFKQNGGYAELENLGAVRRCCHTYEQLTLQISDSKGTRSLNPEKVRHMLYGSLAGIDRTIKILHALGYTDPNDGRDSIPVPPTSDTIGATSPAGIVWMVIATKTVLIE